MSFPCLPACDKSCNKCSGPTSRDCSQCEVGWVREDGACVGKADGPSPVGSMWPRPSSGPFPSGLPLTPCRHPLLHSGCGVGGTLWPRLCFNRLRAWGLQAVCWLRCVGLRGSLPGLLHSLHSLGSRLRGWPCTSLLCHRVAGVGWGTPVGSGLGRGTGVICPVALACGLDFET